MGDLWRCHVETPKGMQAIDVQVVLIGVGRKPNVDGIGLETIGHICCEHASDLLQEAVLAIKLEATLDELVDTIHPHPTMVEALMEAFHDAAGHCIHKA